VSFMRLVVCKIQLFKYWVFLPRSDFFLFRSLILLKYVYLNSQKYSSHEKNNELEHIYLALISAPTGTCLAYV
jgi:hypothetical protein